MMFIMAMRTVLTQSEAHPARPGCRSRPRESRAHECARGRRAHTGPSVVTRHRPLGGSHRARTIRVFLGRENAAFKFRKDSQVRFGSAFLGRLRLVSEGSARAVPNESGKRRRKSSLGGGQTFSRAAPHALAKGLPEKFPKGERECEEENTRGA